MHNDEELSKFLKEVVIASGGVLPNIHSFMLPKRPMNEATSFGFGTAGTAFGAFGAAATTGFSFGGGGDGDEGQAY